MTFQLLMENTPIWNLTHSFLQVAIWMICHTLIYTLKLGQIQKTNLCAWNQVNITNSIFPLEVFSNTLHFKVKVMLSKSTFSQKLLMSLSFTNLEKLSNPDSSLKCLISMLWVLSVLRSSPPVCITSKFVVSRSEMRKKVFLSTQQGPQFIDPIHNPSNLLFNW